MRSYRLAGSGVTCLDVGTCLDGAVVVTVETAGERELTVETAGERELTVDTPAGLHLGQQHKVPLFLVLVTGLELVTVCMLAEAQMSWRDCREDVQSSVICGRMYEMDEG